MQDLVKTYHLIDFELSKESSAFYAKYTRAEPLPQDLSHARGHEYDDWPVRYF